MERQSNNRRTNRNQGRVKRIRYSSVCIAFCLLIAGAVFGAVNLLKGSEAPPSPDNEIVSSGEGFFQGGHSQKETISPAPAPASSVDSISADVVAKNVVVMNADANTLLYQKNSTDKIAPASTAKLITALTVLDYCSTDDEMTVGTEIELMHEDSSRAWLNQGDILTTRQLLVALLLPSGNDAAYTLAVNAGKKIAGDSNLTNAQSIDTFMDKVNEKARMLGLENSNFLAPDGYDTEGQYTTAYDLVIIVKACLDDPYISEIVSSYTSYQKWVSGREVTYNNSNELLNPNSQYYRPEVIGLKTGASGLAGSCIVSAAIINEETYICVVMGSTKDARFQDSIAIYDKIKSQ